MAVRRSGNVGTKSEAVLLQSNVFGVGSEAYWKSEVGLSDEVGFHEEEDELSEEASDNGEEMPLRRSSGITRGVPASRIQQQHPWSRSSSDHSEEEMRQGRGRSSGSKKRTRSVPAPRIQQPSPQPPRTRSLPAASRRRQRHQEQEQLNTTKKQRKTLLLEWLRCSMKNMKKDMRLLKTKVAELMKKSVKSDREIGRLVEDVLREALTKRYGNRFSKRYLAKSLYDLALLLPAEALSEMYKGAHFDQVLKLGKDLAIALVDEDEPTKLLVTILNAVKAEGILERNFQIQFMEQRDSAESLKKMSAEARAEYERLKVQQQELAKSKSAENLERSDTKRKIVEKLKSSDRKKQRKEALLHKMVGVGEDGVGVGEDAVEVGYGSMEEDLPKYFTPEKKDAEQTTEPMTEESADCCFKEVVDVKEDFPRYFMPEKKEAELVLSAEATHQNIGTPEQKETTKPSYYNTETPEQHKNNQTPHQEDLPMEKKSDTTQPELPTDTTQPELPTEAPEQLSNEENDEMTEPGNHKNNIKKVLPSNVNVLTALLVKADEDQESTVADQKSTDAWKLLLDLVRYWFELRVNEDGSKQGEKRKDALLVSLSSLNHYMNLKSRKEKVAELLETGSCGLYSFLHYASPFTFTDVPLGRFPVYSELEFDTEGNVWLAGNVCLLHLAEIKKAPDHKKFIQQLGLRSRVVRSVLSVGRGDHPLDFITVCDMVVPTGEGELGARTVLQAFVNYDMHLRLIEL